MDTTTDTTTESRQFQEKYQAVRRLAAGPLDGPDTTLWEYMAAGYWQTMTAEQIAHEWNELEAAK